MSIKEFLKPSKGKIIIFFLIILISILVFIPSFLIGIASLGPSIFSHKDFYLLSTINFILFLPVLVAATIPWAEISYFLSRGKEVLFFLIYAQEKTIIFAALFSLPIYWYFLACLISSLYQKIKKRKK